MTNIDELMLDIARKLEAIFAHERWENFGKVPTILKNDNLVLGFHMGLAHKYFSDLGGNYNDQEAIDLEIDRIIGLVLEADVQTVSDSITDLLNSKNEEFQLGIKMSIKAWKSIAAGNPLALMEFKMALKEKYNDL